MKRKLRDKKIPLIAASEVADFAYCERAWYLKRIGAEPEGEQLADGNAFHARHGETVEGASTMRQAAIVCILLAILFFLAAVLFSE
jgi:hypothetical protein